MAEASIGERAAQAIRERVEKNHSTIRDEVRSLDATPKTFYGWEHGNLNPNAYLLRQMALQGYDIMWILLGGKEDVR